MPHQYRQNQGKKSERQHTKNLLKQTLFRGWPDKRKNCPYELHEYWNFRCDLVLDDGLILKGNRIVVPTSLRDKVLKAIHTAHQGQVKSIRLAREFVYWPGLTGDIKNMVMQ